METYLLRYNKSDQGSLGMFFIPDSDFDCYMLELPWRNNMPNFSCIPVGRYLCKPYRSPRFGMVYMVTGVEGRSYILFHAGNWAGDSKKGYHTNSHGCILPGSKPFYSVPKTKKQIGVASSRNTLGKIKNIIGQQEFYLTVA